MKKKFKGLHVLYFRFENNKILKNSRFFQIQKKNKIWYIFQKKVKESNFIDVLMTAST